MKPDNVVRIPTSLDGKFFRYWFEFLVPIHKLSPREIDVITKLVELRYKLSKAISDDSILDEVVMSKDNKKKIREECGLSIPHFQVLMGKLKARKLIVNGKINSKFIPNIPKGENSVQLLLFFDLK